MHFFCMLTFPNICHPTAGGIPFLPLQGSLRRLVGHTPLFANFEALGSET